jgi:hypothetical protein
MIHVCVPTIKRYDMLCELAESLTKSTVPYELRVIDNGRNPEKLHGALNGYLYQAYMPPKPMGVAESWNWFIDYVPEERIISNDDILFAPDSLERIVASSYELTWTKEAGFSCFLIRDRCVQKVGVFDESISPGYGYYEDEDYAQRVDGKGTKPPLCSRGDVVSGVEHRRSSTLAVATPEEMEEHHRRFWVAQINYMRKYGIKEMV